MFDPLPFLDRFMGDQEGGLLCVEATEIDLPPVILLDGYDLFHLRCEDFEIEVFGRHSGIEPNIGRVKVLCQQASPPGDGIQHRLWWLTCVSLESGRDRRRGFLRQKGRSTRQNEGKRKKNKRK